MTNFEKVKEDLRIEDVGADPCKVIHRIRKENTCFGRTCEECREWLEEEYVEPVELTEAERTILQNVDKKYKYIARDKNGNLYMYEDRPTRGISMWINSIISTHMRVFNHLFQFVQWEDTNPYNIEELLGGDV